MRKTGGESDGGRKKDTVREGKEERKREIERERERSRASCSHYLTYYTGSMPPRPSRGPTSLHLASLGSPFALLTGLPSASSFCLLPAPPPLPVLPLTPSHTRRLLSPPRLSRHARARLRVPLPHDHPPVLMSLLSSSFYLRPLPLLLYRRLLSRVSTSPSSSSSSSSLPASPHPAPAPCSSSSAPTEHSHRPFVYEGTKRLSVSSRLVSLDSLSLLSLLRSWLLLLPPLPSFFLPCSPSAASSSFVPYSTQPPPLPPLDSPTPLSLSRSLLVRVV